MVDLPVPDQPDVLAQTPTPRVSGFQYARAGSFLSQGLDRLSDGLNDMAVSAAKDQAASDLQSGAAVTRDAQGNIQVGTPGGLPILGPAGVEYEHAIAAGQLAQGDNLMRQDVADLAAKNQGNPQGMRQAISSYTNNFATRNPGQLGVSMAQEAQNLGTQYYDGAVMRQAETDTQNAKQALIDNQTAKFNDAAGLAMQPGGTNTPEFQKAYGDYLSISQQLVANPKFGVSADIQAANDKDAHAKLMGYSIAGQAVKDMQGPGGTQTALSNLRTRIYDPSLNLSPAERQQMLALGEAQIQFQTHANEGDIAGLRTDFAALQSDVASGKIAMPPMPVLQAVLAKSQALGDTQTTKQISAFIANSAYSGARRVLMPEQQLNAQGIGADPGASPGYSYSGAVAQHESGGNAGVVNSIGAGGLYQFTPATWAGLSARHPELNLLPEGYHDASPAGVAQQNRAFAAFTADNRAQLQAAGIEPTDKNAFMAHFLGAGGAVQFLKAAQQTPNATFAGLFPKEAASNATIAYDKSNGGAPRTLAQVYGLMTKNFAGTATVGAPSANGFPFTPQQVQDNPFLLSSWVRAQAADAEGRTAAGKAALQSIVTRIDAGFVPPVNDVAMAAQLAAGNPRLADLSQTVRGKLDGQAIEGKLINMAPGQAEGYLGAIKATAAQSPDLYHITLADQAAKLYAGEVKQRQETPIQYAVAKGIASAPNPLDFSSAQALAVGLHQRDAIVQKVEGLSRAGTLPALDPSEVGQVKNVLATGTLQQRMTIAQAIGTLPEARQRATLAATGKTGGDGATFAVAGALAQENPQAGQDMLLGQQMLKEKSDFAPPAAKFNSSFSQFLPENMLPGARDKIAAGVLALYAKASADANDTTRIVNRDRMQAAVDEVTGGLVKSRGQTLMGPWYKAGQNGFDAALQSVTDADMTGSRLSDGSPLPAAALKPGLSNWWNYGRFQLENEGAGNGRYRIFTGTGATKSYVKDANGGPFILDLGAKRAAVDAANSTTPYVGPTGRAYRPGFEPWNRPGLSN